MERYLFVLIFQTNLAGQHYLARTALLNAIPLSNDFNVLINGFLNCLVEVVFPKQVQDFEDPPQTKTPITLSYFKKTKNWTDFSDLTKLKIHIKSNCFVMCYFFQSQTLLRQI